MTSAKPSFTPTPRMLDAFQVSARLGKGAGWLKEHRAELEAAGFPTCDELLGGTDGNAIEDWFDRRSELKKAVNDEQAWMEAINGKG